MKNENMGVEDLYLAPDETNNSDLIVSSDKSEPETSKTVPTTESKKKPRKAKRIEELPEQRGTHSKVFRMNDGTEQAVFSPSAIHVFDDETHTYEDIETTLTEEKDGKHYISGKNHFVAKFSCEDDNDELFFIEKGVHKVTVYARKNKKNRNKGIKPVILKNAKGNSKASDILTFANVEPDTDYEYAIAGDGVKENIIIKKPTTVYRYPFALKCENVTAHFDEDAKRVAFYSNESGDEVFFIPAPFMTDANGMASTDVNFEMKTADNGLLNLTVTADADWLNASDRTFPVAIDPQIKLSGSSDMTTYSWENGKLYNASFHTVGTTGEGDGICNAKRMYMKFDMPTLPRNPRIKKAELHVFQASSVGKTAPLFGLYQVTDEICPGECTPIDNSNLIDFARMTTEHSEDEEGISYAFDITTLIDIINKNESYYPQLVLKMLDESIVSQNTVTLYGSSNGNEYSPKIVITYESSYGVNTSYRTHTHELGRFGHGSVDLQCGNLMFESEDFAWSGNRMPVTIKHLYNSALAGYTYTNNSAIKLATAAFSAMKLGYGFKLNLMQSMMPASFRHEGEVYSGYVYIGENGEETYFKENEKEIHYDSNSQCYHLYEDVNESGMVYDPDKRTMTQGEDIYLFDASGRLNRITDAFKNHMDITYTAGRITSVTDGAGREFGFDYNSSDQLTAITAPDGTHITYSYTNSLLTCVTYPDNKKAVIAYSASKPTSVTLQDAAGKQVYKVAYTFSGNRLYSVSEYGSDNSIGAKSTYSYSAASSRTLVTTTEQKDADEGETSNNVITTVYTFDDDGNVISEYVYSKDTEKVGANGEASGINPHSGDGGAGVISNIDNLLIGHNFESLDAWSELPNNCGDFTVRNNENESHTKFGKKYLYLQSRNDCCGENGIYQVTNELPAGQYSFSAYMLIFSQFSGCDDPGAFIRVTDTDGNILGVSERLAERDTSHTRLIVPFTLEKKQSVQVQILTSGRGVAFVDAAQLEKNPYANAYNMLENGNFERGVAGWHCSSGVYSVSGTCFNMSKSLCMSGSLEKERYAYQQPSVYTNRSTRETFTLSGWAKGYGLPNHDRDGVANAPQFGLRAVITYTDNSTNTIPVSFSPCTEDWQFVSVQFAKDQYKTIRHIRIYCDYSYNSGLAYFDNIQLVRNGLEKNLTESDFSGASSVETLNEETSSTEEIEAVDTTPAFEELKDRFGNTLTETTFTDGEFGTIYRAFKFNADDANMTGDDSGNNLIEEIDARGNKTTYTVDSDTSRNEEVIDRLGNKTVYEYDTSGRTTKVTNKLYAEETGELKNPTVSYAYDTFDNMTEIVRGDGMKYVLAYNAFHNLESIGITDEDDQSEQIAPLIQYTYKNGNGRLKQMTYANGHTMKAVYNSIGQMVAERWFDKNGVETAHYKYVYDGEGNIVRSIDIFACKEYNYEYEEGRIVRATELDITLSGELVTGKSLVNTIKYYYDYEGKLTRKRIVPCGGSAQNVYYETNDNNTVVKFSVGGRTVTSHSKTDSFGRKVFDELQLGTDFVSRQFVYHAGKATAEHKEKAKVKSSATTQLVSQIILSDGRTLTYDYDEEERIVSVADSFEGTTTYTYDALGQLLTEAVNGEVVNSMEYDNYGNITKKNGKAYTYGNATWKDLLTSYNGQAIEYDAQGNPLTYLGHTLTWEKGRQLKSFDGNTYTYNANGIRTSKKVNGVKHEYILDGTKILRETWDGNTLVPLYDNEDGVCGILYNNAPYYFIKNLQGDVIAIVDKDARTVARYSYDAWGAVTSAVTYAELTENVDIATINPFRYRGYYYDEEIGLYYLQSRYYNANVGRFVNGDEVDFVTFEKSTFSTNLYQYCANNCINEKDLYGNLGISSLLSVIGDSLNFIFSIGETAVCEDKKYKNLSAQIKNAKNRNAKKKLIKEQSKLLKSGIGKGFYYVVKILGYILLVMPLIKYILDWANDKIIFVEFLVCILIDAIIEILCTLASKLISLIPTAGIILGFAGSWLIGKLLNAHFNDSRKSKIAKYYNSQLPRLTSLKAWIFSFGSALSI